MKKILIVLAVMALPQVVGLSTICNAGPHSYCSSLADGSCEGPSGFSPCGSYSSGNRCYTIVNTAAAASAAKKVKPPQEITPFLCVCQ